VVNPSPFDGSLSGVSSVVIAFVLVNIFKLIPINSTNPYQYYKWERYFTICSGFTSLKHFASLPRLQYPIPRLSWILQHKILPSEIYRQNKLEALGCDINQSNPTNGMQKCSRFESLIAWALGRFSLARKEVDGKDMIETKLKCQNDRMCIMESE
jgi:hypothetical protein